MMKMAEKEYLSREDAIDAVQYVSKTGIVKEFSPADVAPVVHGKWVERFIRPWYGVIASMRCSECGCVFIECGGNGGNYCPNCGARMDGD